MASSVFLPSKGVQASRELLKSFALAGLLFCPAALAQGAEAAQLAIKVDQVGYPLDGPKVALVGTSQCVFVVSNRPVLGRWQAIFFCEFDGPREREVLVRVSRDS